MVQVPDRLGALALDVLHLPEHAPKFGVEGVPPPLDLSPHLIGKTDELLLGDWSSVDDRDGQEADGAHLDDETLFLGALVDPGDKIGPSPLERLEGLIAPFGILFALKRSRERPTCLFDEPFHILSEPDAPPRREGDGVWFVLVLEIVDIDPVARPGFGLRELVKETPDGGHPPGPLGARGVDVEPGLPYLKTERERPECPFLADDLFERPHLFGAGALHLSRLVDVPVLSDIQWLNHLSHQVPTTTPQGVARLKKGSPGAMMDGFNSIRAYV